MNIYYPLSIPSEIDLDRCSTYPAIMEIEKKNYFSVVGVSTYHLALEISTYLLTWHTVKALAHLSYQPLSNVIVIRVTRIT